MLVLRLIKESFRFALDSLIVNKLRTFLSLLGITIGIFAMISVFAAVDSMERGIKDGFSELGDNVIYIQKWPWNFSSGQPWWDYIRRPMPSLDEYKMLRRGLTKAKAVGMIISGTSTLKYKSNSVENSVYVGTTFAYSEIWELNFSDGRYFAESETISGRPVAIIGASVAEGLFGDQRAVGKRFKLKGRKVEVIGVLEREGESMLGPSKDEQILVPLNFSRNFLDIRRESAGATIMVKAKEGFTNDDLIGELTGIMRSLRKLKPKADDNFALNELSLLSQGVTQIFGVINIAGLIIGLFSIIVGGFSIANIMFVSVRERTSIIGVQKALGAKNYFILLQFLFEAIFLCLIGGILGLFLIFIISLIAQLAGFELVLSLGNIMLGISISVVIGLLSGFIPSLMASRLDPVEAIRST